MENCGTEISNGGTSKRGGGMDRSIRQVIGKKKDYDHVMEMRESRVDRRELAQAGERMKGMNEMKENSTRKERMK